MVSSSKPNRYQVKGVFAGSGRHCFRKREVCEAVLDLTGKPPAEVNIVYFGTAYYDLPGPLREQTSMFKALGANIYVCKVADDAYLPSYQEISDLLEEADVILVSGGNSLFAVDRLRKLKIDILIEREVQRGCVIAGGSAGTMCWFDGGQSQSANPKMFKEYVIGNPDDAPETEWDYIRISSFGFLPGLVCPHADKRGRNGTVRTKDFDNMLLRHHGERGLCLDHWACLVIDGDRYWQIRIPGKRGSVKPDGTFSANRAKGCPGIWIKEAKNGKVVSRLVPQSGDIDELLRPAKAIIHDLRVESIRVQNPA